MAPVPLRPLQNALIILATFLVAGALLPWSGRLRLACSAGAIAIVLIVFVARLRAHAAALHAPAAISETQARIDRIRAARDARMGRRRP